MNATSGHNDPKLVQPPQEKATNRNGPWLILLHGCVNFLSDDVRKNFG